jgi:hypothetical protein
MMRRISLSFLVLVILTVCSQMADPANIETVQTDAEDVSAEETEFVEVMEKSEYSVTPEPEYIPYVVEVPEGAEDTYISEEIQNACIEIGDKNGYCAELLMAIIESESSGRQYAENGPCKGLMQINMSNSDVVEYMDEQGYTDIFDIYTNIEMGCYVLDQKREIFGDDLYAVLMAYNGSRNVRDRAENEDYTDYAIRIVDRSGELERVHGK